MKFEGVINFSDTHQKRKFLTECGALNVPHQIEMKPYTPRRSNQANRYWFGVCVRAFCKFQEEQGEHYSPERAHALIVRNVLGTVEITNPRTGEVYKDRRETHNMSKEEFSEFIERGHAWLADWGIIVETRDEFERMETSCRHTTESC